MSGADNLHIVREMFREVFSDVYERVMLATDCHDTYNKTDMIRVPSALGYFSVVYIISNPLPDLNYLYRSIQQNYLNILNTQNVNKTGDIIRLRHIPYRVKVDIPLL